MQCYEDELKHPIRNLVSGQLARSLLIQVCCIATSAPVHIKLFPLHLPWLDAGIFPMGSLCSVYNLCFVYAKTPRFRFQLYGCQ